MMSFYEEFGVRNDASLEEIRQAYKTLARILHPDGQTDEKLKTAAARQMKRLHEILDILADSQKRRVYDETLIAAAYPDAALHWTRMEAVVRPPGKSGLGQSVLQHWSWILVGCVILGSGFWCITARGPVPLESARIFLRGCAAASRPHSPSPGTSARTGKRAFRSGSTLTVRCRSRDPPRHS